MSRPPLASIASSSHKYTFHCLLQSDVPKLRIGGMTYRIEYSPETDDHLQARTARQRSIVFDAVDKQLAHQPTIETRNRKPMRPNPVAPWELRIGNLRVYYDITEEPDKLVTVLAVGVKHRNRLLIGGKEIQL